MFQDAIAGLLAKVADQMAAVHRGDRTLAEAAANLGMVPDQLQTIYRAHLLDRVKRSPIKAH